jgi:hypothetical protein
VGRGGQLAAWVCAEAELRAGQLGLQQRGWVQGVCAQEA